MDWCGQATARAIHHLLGSWPVKSICAAWAHMLPVPAAAQPLLPIILTLRLQLLWKTQRLRHYSLVQNTNLASFGVGGAYCWPQLKPDSFPQFFYPEKHYRLLAADVAPKIQRLLSKPAV